VAATVSVESGSDEAGEARLHLMATSFTMKKRTEDEQGKKIA
jgi:hypothetical protein